MKLSHEQTMILRYLKDQVGRVARGDRYPLGPTDQATLSTLLLWESQF